MKVICIDDNWDFDGGIIHPAPRFNEVVTVTVAKKIDGDDYYNLLEYGVEYWYEQPSFIPLSSIDETEIIKQRETVNA